jgi:uncharacterized protein YcfL
MRAFPAQGLLMTRLCLCLPPFVLAACSATQEAQVTQAAVTLLNDLGIVRAGIPVTAANPNPVPAAPRA